MSFKSLLEEIKYQAKIAFFPVKKEQDREKLGEGTSNCVFAYSSPALNITAKSKAEQKKILFTRNEFAVYHTKNPSKKIASIRKDIKAQDYDICLKGNQPLGKNKIYLEIDKGLKQLT